MLEKIDDQKYLRIWWENLTCKISEAWMYWYNVFSIRSCGSNPVSCDTLEEYKNLITYKIHINRVDMIKFYYSLIKKSNGELIIGVKVSNQCACFISTNWWNMTGGKHLYLIVFIWKCFYWDIKIWIFILFALCFK